MPLIRSVHGAAAIACGLTLVAASPGDDKPPGPADAPIQAVVAHFATHGIKLRHEDGGRWVVTEPKAESYEVIVHLRAFPPTATEKEMRDALRVVNLAYLVNAPAHVAMSYPYFRGTKPGQKPTGTDADPVAPKLAKLFQDYRPPGAKK